MLKRLNFEAKFTFSTFIEEKAHKGWFEDLEYLSLVKALIRAENNKYIILACQKIMAIVFWKDELETLKFLFAVTFIIRFFEIIMILAFLLLLTPFYYYLVYLFFESGKKMSYSDSIKTHKKAAGMIQNALTTYRDTIKEAKHMIYNKDRTNMFKIYESLRILPILVAFWVSMVDLRLSLIGGLWGGLLYTHPIKDAMVHWAIFQRDNLAKKSPKGFFKNKIVKMVIKQLLKFDVLDRGWLEKVEEERRLSTKRRE